MSVFQLTVNGQKQLIEADGETPLLWILREELRLTGTKFGCGIGQCGACTVLVNGEATRACILPVDAIGDGAVETIEFVTTTGLGQSLVEAWVKRDVPQCGYCQSGQIVAAVAILRKNNASDLNLGIIKSTILNLCRCGTYEQIHQAVLSAAQRG